MKKLSKQDKYWLKEIEKTKKDKKLSKETKGTIIKLYKLGTKIR